MKKALEKLEKNLKKYKDMLTYNFDENLNPNANEFGHDMDSSAKDVPDIPSTAKIGEKRADKMKDAAHMNGTNTQAYNYWAEDKLDPKVNRVVRDIAKEEQREEMEGEQQMIKPPEPSGLDSKRKPVTHDECGHPFGKDEIDEKIKAKMKQEMDRRNFGEADATRHVIDRDRGEKEAQKPKEKPLLQTEVVKFDKNGQWSIEKSNYGPKGMGLYSQKDNIQRKMKNIGESLEGTGKNVNAKKYTTSGSSMQQAHEAAQAKQQRAKAKASTKVYSDEEKKALEEKMRSEGKIK